MKEEELRRWMGRMEGDDNLLEIVPVLPLVPGLVLVLEFEILDSIVLRLELLQGGGGGGGGGGGAELDVGKEVEQGEGVGREMRVVWWYLQLGAPYGGAHPPPGPEHPPEGEVR